MGIQMVHYQKLISRVYNYKFSDNSENLKQTAV